MCCHLWNSCWNWISNVMVARVDGTLKKSWGLHSWKGSMLLSGDWVNSPGSKWIPAFLGTRLVTTGTSLCVLALISCPLALPLFCQEVKKQEAFARCWCHAFETQLPASTAKRQNRFPFKFKCFHFKLPSLVCFLTIIETKLRQYPIHTLCFFAERYFWIKLSHSPI